MFEMNYKKYLKMKKRAFIAIIFLSLVNIYSCKKEPGEGGNATVYGRVWVRDYNPTFSALLDSYWAQNEDVFIIYGNEKGVSDRVRTSYNGSYQFKFLRPGKYTIFAYSKDSTLQTLAEIPIIKTITIGNNDNEVEVPQIDILK